MTEACRNCPVNRLVYVYDASTLYALMSDMPDGLRSGPESPTAHARVAPPIDIARTPSSSSKAQAGAGRATARTRTTADARMTHSRNRPQRVQEITPSSPVTLGEARVAFPADDDVIDDG